MPLDPNLIAQRSASELKERAHRQMKSRLGRPDDGVYISPNFGDGGAHTQYGAVWFDPRSIQPLGDHIVVEIDAAEVHPLAIAPIETGTRMGKVLSIGPGRWKEEVTHKDRDIFRRLPMTVKPGDRVILGLHSDWESAQFGYPGPNIGLFQERDVRLYGSAN